MAARRSLFAMAERILALVVERVVVGECQYHR